MISEWIRNKRCFQLEVTSSVYRFIYPLQSLHHQKSSQRSHLRPSSCEKDRNSVTLSHHNSLQFPAEHELIRRKLRSCISFQCQVTQASSHLGQSCDPSLDAFYVHLTQLFSVTGNTCADATLISEVFVFSLILQPTGWFKWISKHRLGHVKICFSTSPQ